MSEHESIERAVGVIAEACARVLGTLGHSAARAEGVEVLEAGADPFADLPRPVVSARVPFVGVVEGDNLFLLSPEHATRLASAMMGGHDPGEELGEIEPSAVAEAMNQMMGGACSALADDLSIEADIAPPEVVLLGAEDDTAALVAGASSVARFRLANDELEATIVQVIPSAFASSLHDAVDSASHMREVIESSRPEIAAANNDATFSAV